MQFWRLKGPFTTCQRGRECLTSIEPDEVAARLFHTLERSAGPVPVAP